MEKIEYDFLSEVFLRAPFYSYQDYSLSSLHQMIDKEDFRNAIFFASPDFYDVLSKKSFEYDKFSDKEKVTLCKYYNRMCFRSTPFGSFASFTNVHWGNNETIDLVGPGSAILHRLPDQKLRMQLLSHLKTQSSNFSLTLNPICYLVGGGFRFVKTTEDVEGHNNFSLETIAAEDLNVSIVNLLKSSHLKYHDLVQWICNEANCSLEESSDYLDFLINEQVILTSYSGNIINDDELSDFKSSADPTLSKIADGFNELKDLSLASLTDTSTAYHLLKSSLDDINIQISNQHFYSAIERPLLTGSVDIDVQQRLAKAIDLLKRIAKPFTPPNLENFIKDFKERFDMEKVPLLIALDPDTGLSYGNLIDDRHGMGLLDDIDFPERMVEPKPLKWSKIHQFMLKLWAMDNSRAPYDPLVIDESYLAELNDEIESEHLPSTLALMFRKQRGKLVIESLGGSTATSLIGRFTKFSDEVTNLCRKLTKVEVQANENIVFADLGQLSDTHVDNINRRSKIYDYEIPINVHSDLPESYQIRPDDLIVSVVGDELILESILLKKRVIPRLTTAYNPTKTDLSIFRLLCDLQHQSLKSGISFDLERLFPGMPFYPAVEFENIIISPAKWFFQENDLKDIKSCRESELYQSMVDFRKKFALPELVMLGNFDQQLVFNLTKENEIKFFLQCIKNDKGITLKEFSWPDESVVAEGKPLLAQFIAFLKHHKKVYQELNKYQLPVNVETKRNFYPGSEWLYLKLFCTPQMANTLLINVVKPVLDENQDLCPKWFFIRYLEKGYHLRVRIHAPIEAQAKILAQITSQLESASLSKEYQLDTYKREIERYGSDLIDEVEGLFCDGSILIINYLKSNSENHETITPFQLAIIIVLEMMDISIPEINQKIAFLETISNSFLKEFSLNKSLKTSLDKRFRECHDEIKMVKNDDVLKKCPTSSLTHDLQNYINSWQLISAGIVNHERGVTLMADVIHMQINRLFPLEQRKHELIVYYCLNKYFIAHRARLKKEITEFNYNPQ